jgi:hypothetical protein
MSTHTIQTEIELKFTFPGLADGEWETSYPTVELTYDYEPGGRELSFREVKLIKADGFTPEPEHLQDWAEQWLLFDGYDYACDCAELDLLAMRHAHLEGSRDQCALWRAML